jgi:hypothetical protein
MDPYMQAFETIIWSGILVVKVVVKIIVYLITGLFNQANQSFDDQDPPLAL